MTEQPDIYYKSIGEGGLPKKAIAILRECDRVIRHYNELARKPESVALFPDDFRYLAEQLEKTDQNINQTTYRGYRLRKYG